MAKRVFVKKMLWNFGNLKYLGVREPEAGRGLARNASSHRISTQHHFWRTPDFENLMKYLVRNNHTFPSTFQSSKISF